MKEGMKIFLILSILVFPMLFGLADASAYNCNMVSCEIEDESVLGGDILTSQLVCHYDRDNDGYASDTKLCYPHESNGLPCDCPPNTKPSSMLFQVIWDRTVYDFPELVIDCDDYDSTSTDECYPELQGGTSGDLIKPDTYLSGYCEGTYTSGCTVYSGTSCSQFTEYSGDYATGCSLDFDTLQIPSGCFETQECYRMGDYGCEDYETVCAGTPDCQECSNIMFDGVRGPQYCDTVSSTCSGLTESNCNAYLGCNWIEVETPAGCAENQIEEFQSCSGTYYTTTESGNCEGSYTTCLDQNNDGLLLEPLRSFFGLITGRALDDLQCSPEYVSEPIFCHGSTESQCESLNSNCYWESSTYTFSSSCSGFTESQCNANSACTANYECVEIPDVTAPSISITYPSAYSDILDSVNQFTFRVTDNRDASISCSSTIKNSAGTITYNTQASTTYANNTLNTKTFSAITSPPDKALKLTITCTDSSGNSRTVERPFNVVADLLGTCSVCSSNADCESGTCATVLGSSTKRCVESTNCAIDASLSCERALGSQNCLGTSSLVTCSSNNLWSITSCPYGCSGTSSGSSCNAAPTPVLEWRTETGFPITSSLGSPLTASIPHTLLLSVTNPQSTTGTMSIYEYNANTGSTIATTESNLPAFLNEGKMYYMWTIDNSKYNSFAGSGDVYQFKFTYSGISAPSNSLYFEKTSTHCDNGIMDEDEEGDDCGGSLCVECTVEQFCNNNVMDNGEEGIDCGGLCAACPVEKEARWSPVGPYTFDWESIYEGNNEFSMILSNADDATESFSIFRKRTWPTSDIELSSTTGEISGTDLIGEWLMSKESFPETSGTYNFYFRVDGERSPDLEITVEGDRPTCGDGVCDAYAGEDSTSCLEDCEFICLGVTTCSDYGSDQDACGGNVCGISSVGGDSCFFDTDLGMCAGERVNRVYNGQDIGSCFYTENMDEDTCDDDGMLTYSWTTLWQWATTNTRDVPTSGDCSELGDGYIFDIDTNYCHYDPEYAKNECVGDNGGSTTIPCSAQIQLNFFTLNNLIAAILIVVIAYIILNYARKVKSSKKVIPATKPTSKKPATKAPKKSVKKTAKKKVLKKK